MLASADLILGEHNFGSHPGCREVCYIESKDNPAATPAGEDDLNVLVTSDKATLSYSLKKKDLEPGVNGISGKKAVFVVDGSRTANSEEFKASRANSVPVLDAPHEFRAAPGVCWVVDTSEDRDSTDYYVRVNRGL